KKFVASTNTINLSKISQFMLDDADQFEKNNVPVLVSVNKGKVTSVPFKEDDFKIVSVGRLSTEKGFDLLIDAVGKVIVHYPN
ncbi:hypothetical protein WL260_12590, partial [Staphylococcus epidermidis]|uniref:hypothetical protein n=1 Tax=Staphylococcus epidermidis TaxID=1282 RepID=UPI0030C4BB6E